MKMKKPQFKLFLSTIVSDSLTSYGYSTNMLKKCEPSTTLIEHEYNFAMLDNHINFKTLFKYSFQDPTFASQNRLRTLFDILDKLDSAQVLAKEVCAIHFATLAKQIIPEIKANLQVEKVMILIWRGYYIEQNLLDDIYKVEDFMFRSDAIARYEDNIEKNQENFIRASKFLLDYKLPNLSQKTALRKI